MDDIDYIPLAFEMYFTRPHIDDPGVKHRVKYPEGQISVETARATAKRTLELLTEGWEAAGQPGGEAPSCEVRARAPRDWIGIWDSKADDGDRYVPPSIEAPA